MGEELIYHGSNTVVDNLVSSYLYIQNHAVNICTFEKMTEEWLQFVVNCRRGIEHLRWPP